jgi:hypothetical protein
MNIELKEILIDSTKYIIPAFLGFIFAIWGTNVGKKKDIKNQSKTIAKLLIAEVFNEIIPTIDVAHGFEKNILQKKFNPAFLSIIYSPNSEIIGFNNIGILKPKIIDSYILYKQGIRVCEQTRQNLISSSEMNNENLSTNYLTYLISLDTVIKRGINLITEIQNIYEFSNYNETPNYRLIDFNILAGSLKATNE